MKFLGFISAFVYTTDLLHGYFRHITGLVCFFVLHPLVVDGVATRLLHFSIFHSARLSARASRTDDLATLTHQGGRFTVGQRRPYMVANFSFR